MISNRPLAWGAKALMVAAVASCTIGQTAAEPLCGSTRVVGGEDAVPGAWPSQAALLYNNNGGGRLCGGTVIDPKWVLTAAHCFTGARLESDWMVVVGTLNWDKGDGDRIRVRRIIVKDEYSDSRKGDDLALIELARAASVRPIPLVLEETRQRLAPVGTSAVVVGWGYTQGGTTEELEKNGAPSSTLQQAVVPLVDRKTCMQKYPYLAESQVCAGYAAGGRDSCLGDSGGPLMVRDGRGRYVQVGIVSYGIGCAQPNYYGIYERPGAHLAWIRQHVPDVSVAEAPASPATGDQGLSGLVQDLFSGTPDGTVTLSVLPQPQVKVGARIRLRVEALISGNLLLFDANDKGELVQLFPNEESLKHRANREIKAGRPRIYPGSAYDGFELAAVDPGRGKIMAIVSKDATGVEDLVKRHLDLEPISDPRAHLGAVCGALRSVALSDQRSWALASQEYEIVP
jgi:secreted trypsin-like serine protease